MPRIYVDFGKGVDDQIDIAYAGEGALNTLTLHDGESVILYDSSLEVQATVHPDESDARIFWYAVPQWSTQQNYQTDLAQSA